LAEVDGGGVDGQALGLGPEVEGVSGAAAFEAVEDIGLQVDGEATAGAGRGAVQGTRSAVLGVGSAWFEAEQCEDGGDGDGGADGGEVDGGRDRRRRGSQSLLLLVLVFADAFAVFAGVGESAVAFFGDELMSSFESVLGRDVADGAVEPNGVIMGDEIGDESSGFVEGEGNLGPDAFAFEGFVPPFDFAVGLGIVGGGFDVGHAGDADEFFEVLGDELGSVVGDDARRDAGVGFAGSLDDNFDVGLLHFFADIVVDDEAAAAVEDGAEEVESAGDVEVADIDVPVFVGLQRLDEAGAFFGDVGRSAGQQPGGLEDAVGAGRAASDVIAAQRIGIEHHEGQSPIAFERVLSSEGADAFFFVVGEPMIARQPVVVFIDFAEARFPVVELAGADADPGEEASRGDVGFVAPVADEIDDLIAGVVGDPLTGQGSPRLFFSSV
jgi:hypothetical protein